MGFFDELGKAMGKKFAQAQEVQCYKLEYESMSDNDLKREYDRLRNRSGQECENRFLAVRMVLKDRGFL